jgi:hypothetical protein
MFGSTAYNRGGQRYLKKAGTLAQFRNGKRTTEANEPAGSILPE